MELDVKSIIDSYLSDTEYSVPEQERNQEKALQYYLGQPLGTEVKGRSSIVMAEVRKVIDTLLPDLIENFCGERAPVTFLPRSNEGTEQAKVETDYVNWVINTKNNGFIVCHSWFQDALLHRNGYIKVYWKNEYYVKLERYYGQNPLELEMLMADQTFEITEMTQDANGLFNVSGKRRAGQGRICIENIPPENVYVDRDWRELSLQNCPFVAHKEEVSPSALISQGFDADIVNSLPASSGRAGTDSVDFRRRKGVDSASSFIGGGSGDKMLEVYECYVLYDSDGDGIDERHKVVYEKGSRTILSDEITDHVGVIAITPYPLAHRHIGTSIADRTYEQQRVKTALVRQALDNAYLANNPRVVVNPDKVDMNTILNPAIGAPIVTKGTGTAADVQPFAVPFVAQHIYPLMQYMDQMQEEYTGVSRQSQGIDLSALKDQSIYGVATLIEAMQKRTRYIARVFAETGYRELVKLVRMLTAQYANDEEIFDVTGEQVVLRPREWTQEREMFITVGVGNSSANTRLAALQQIQTLQREVIAAQGGATAGVAATVVDVTHAYNSIADLLQAMGINDVKRYFRNPNEIKPILDQMADQPPPPDPAMVIATQEMQLRDALATAENTVKMAIHNDEMDVEANKQQLEWAKLQVMAEDKGVPVPKP